jgi:hypothetical protein
VAQLQFRNRGADHRRGTLPPTDRLTTPSAQIFAGLVFDLSYFYAMVADFHTRVQYLFSKPRYSVFDELAPQSVWSSAGNTTAYQKTREAVDRKASIRTCKAAN